MVAVGHRNPRSFFDGVDEAGAELFLAAMHRQDGLPGAQPDPEMATLGRSRRCIPCRKARNSVSAGTACQGDEGGRACHVQILARLPSQVIYCIVNVIRRGRIYIQLAVTLIGSRMSGVYEELKGWQSAIGAGFGFVALIIGALFNFWLNRRRDAKLRQEEMLSVATALYGEILLLREEMARLARTVANIEIHDEQISLQFVQDHKPREPILYPAMASKLGLLPVDLIIAITRSTRTMKRPKRIFLCWPSESPASGIVLLLYSTPRESC